MKYTIQIEDTKHSFTVDMITVMKFEELSGKSFSEAFGGNVKMTDLFQFFYAAFLVGAEDDNKKFPYSFRDFMRNTQEWGIFGELNKYYAEGVGKLGKALQVQEPKKSKATKVA